MISEIRNLPHVYLLQVSESVAKLDKLKREKSRAESRLRSALDSVGEVKFPIKDELITVFANQSAGKVAGKHSKPLPEPYLKLESLLPDTSISDALSVWDIIHVFRSTL